jgi:GNAT superfamily N-acetyltransferase
MSTEIVTPISEAATTNDDGEKPDNRFSPCIKTLTMADYKKAALTLFEAFRHDDLANMLTSHLSHDQRRRDKIELRLYEAYAAQHILKGLCHAIGDLGDRFESVALWSLPDSEQNGMESCATLMESGFYKVWLACDDQARSKIFKGMMPLLEDTFERIHGTDARFKEKKVYTLVYLASIKAARGKGNSRKLFEHMFANYIDTSEGNIAYLESSSITNIPIYNKFGFHSVEDIVLGNTINGVPGKDYAIMNVMVRDSFGRDWTNDENSTVTAKGKL